MTPQFTTPCSVLITDKDKREEVCDKLKCLGYEWNGYVPDILQCIYVSNGKVSIGSVGVSKLTSSIDCGTDIALFLDLAGMRSDTIVNQWHIAQTHIMFNKLKGEVVTASRKRYITIGEMFMPTKQNVRFTWFGGKHNELFRKATAAKIIEHFTHKGE